MDRYSLNYQSKFNARKGQRRLKMIMELKRYKDGLEQVVKNLAKQDFNEAVEKLYGLIRDIDYHLENKEIIIQSVISECDLENIYGLDGLKDITGLSLLTKVIDISGEDFKVKNIYLRDSNGNVFQYDKGNNSWIRFAG